MEYIRSIMPQNLALEVNHTGWSRWMIDIVRRESVYLLYYLNIQIELIAPYWIFGMIAGSLISVFGKKKIRIILSRIGATGDEGLLGIIPASLLGIASPLCMFGTIPLAASLSHEGMRDDLLASFMMSSMLLNPQLLIYSGALGSRMVTVRFISCFLCGIGAGLCVRFFFRSGSFFSFGSFQEPESRDVHPNPVVRFLKNLGRNLKATGPWFFLGILLTALYQRYVPQDLVAGLFGPKQRGFGVLIASTLGVPLYVCGGGTIPLLADWLAGGMSAGSAAAFMLSGPATKLTNISALKTVFSGRHFFVYLGYIMLFAIAAGLITDWILR